MLKIKECTFETDQPADFTQECRASKGLDHITPPTKKNKGTFEPVDILKGALEELTYCDIPVQL
jgi:hypothetical protein